MRCYRLLHISYKDHITNKIVCKKNTSSHWSLRRYINNCEKRKLRWLGHVIRSSGLCKKVLQGTVGLPEKRKRGIQKKRWEDNIKDWTGLDFNSSQRAAEDRQRWQKIVVDVNSGTPTTLMVAGHRYIKRRFKRSRKVETKVDIKRRWQQQTTSGSLAVNIWTMISGSWFLETRPTYAVLG